MKLLEKRAVEAEIAAILIQRFETEIGDSRSMEIAAEAVRADARRAGERAAEGMGKNSLTELASIVQELWAKEGALELNFLEISDERLRFDVLRCRYAEMYRKKGLDRYGFCLSCNRDGDFAKGFNPKIKMRRTRTIMEGAPRCDFSFYLKKESSDSRPQTRNLSSGFTE